MNKEDLELCSMNELLKILCAATARIMAENQAPYADITENISGDGITFTINIKAAYTGVENG